MRTERKPRRSPARKDALLRRFEATVGRREMLEALDGSDDERAVALAAMLCDPAYRRFSFAKVCQRVGLRYQDVFDVFRRYQIDVALVRTATRVPEIMDGVVEDALPCILDCPDCSGGRNLGGKLCSSCYGAGQVRISGDIRAIKLLFKMTGLLGRRGSLVAQQFNIAHQDHQTLEERVIATERLMTSKSGAKTASLGDQSGPDDRTQPPLGSGSREDGERV